MSGSTGVNIRATVVAAATPTTMSRTGRQRGLGTRPSGKTCGSTGRVKKYGAKPHTETQVAKPPSSPSPSHHAAYTESTW